MTKNNIVLQFDGLFWSFILLLFLRINDFIVINLLCANLIWTAGLFCTLSSAAALPFSKTIENGT